MAARRDSLDARPDWPRPARRPGLRVRRAAITLLASLLGVCMLAAQQHQTQPRLQLARAISYQPSAISHQLSAISYEPSAISYQLSAISYQPSASNQQLRPQATPAEARAGSVAEGAALFSGQTRFAGGGPACIACHSASGLPFPNGGTLGPNLTSAYRRMGAEGIESILTTLYFPTMYPLYKAHQLTPQERADLAAFLQYSSTQSARESTLPVFGLAALLFVIFMLIIGYAGRDRLLHVRGNLVAQARRQFDARPPGAGNPPKAAAEPPEANTEGEGA